MGHWPGGRGPPSPDLYSQLLHLLPPAPSSSPALSVSDTRPRGPRERGEPSCAWGPSAWVGEPGGIPPPGLRVPSSGHLLRFGRLCRTDACGEVWVRLQLLPGAPHTLSWGGRRPPGQAVQGGRVQWRPVPGEPGIF